MSDVTIRRGRGIQVGLNVERIITAARLLDPPSLTITAVAEQLGVDRKAINHHVTDRETLLALVARDAFSTAFSGAGVASHAAWQDACRAYAEMFTESVMAAGAFAGHLEFDDLPYMTVFLDCLEVLLSRLRNAGFPDEQALGLLALLSNMCLAYAADMVQNQREGQRPRAVRLRDALARRAASAYPELARASALDIDTYGPAQLELTIDVFLAGAEALLTRTNDSGATPRAGSPVTDRWNHTEEEK
ncbi:TetR/AcrR family transcriptional regulator C-terminal domain-containing protein [Homoserinibacter sp. GY 40078]|uniref:TetR/AcrR family transcriptional regulator C-terminal domain-containing protein n=1 Tax=Homoserinibacter sp. GY 40078 TaxID=2603275 RepID=UPI00164F6BDC|nr:TetR/AcrR family transcriptional regulator C-terminal domain-containing protein [Homoserinibacter sp. GY 40078]